MDTSQHHHLFRLHHYQLPYFQDEDGCPDLSPVGDVGIADTDGDGFPDYLDLC
ncbi:thrombospondin type 3 repeat-containing protein, partial [Marine Group I thaumarchaeote SCGC AAA799-E16]